MTTNTTFWIDDNDGDTWEHNEATGQVRVVKFADGTEFTPAPWGGECFWTFESVQRELGISLSPANRDETDILPVGTRVRFRENFGEVGASRIEFTIDSEPFWANPSSGPRRRVVTLRYVNRPKGSSATRLAYMDDLIPA